MCLYGLTQRKRLVEDRFDVTGGDQLETILQVLLVARSKSSLSESYVLIL